MFLLFFALVFYFIYACWEVIFPSPRVKSTFRWSENPANADAHTNNQSPRYVLITGCDSGFGHDLSVQLDREGWSVVSTCLTSEGVSRLAEKCSSQLLAVKCDITKVDDVQNLKKFYLGALEKRGHPNALYGLVNNAGIISGALFEWNSLEDYRKVMEVNFFGHVAMTKAFLPLLIEQCRLQHYARGSARIVNVISMAGLLSGGGFSPYSASKFALEAFTGSLRAETHFYGIDVMFVNPGFMATGIVQGANSNIVRTWQAADAETKQRWGEEFFNRMNSATKLAPSFSESSLKCVHSMLHALQAKSPKRRYLPGWQAKLMFLLPYVPAFFLEYLQNFLGRFCPDQVRNQLKKPAKSTANPAPTLANASELKGN